MGVYIHGIKFTGNATSKETMETFVCKGFERSLLDSEKQMVDFEDENTETIAEAFSISYSNYNNIRDAMAIAGLSKRAADVWDEVDHLASNEEYPTGLHHLINFSDCEGFIGPKAVKEINDFFLANYDKMKKRFVDTYGEDGFYTNCFDRLVECVKKTAAQNGYLNFS